MRKRNAQRGIVIGPILFLIAIIGVLAAAIAAGTGGFSGSSSTASAKVLAAAIIDYADTVKNGVDRVLANGCEDTEISFENPFSSGYYINPNAPSDKSCHVFDVNGGGISMKTPPVGAQNQADYDTATHPAKEVIGKYFIYPICAMGVGSGGYGSTAAANPCSFVDSTTSADLVMILPWVTRDVCLQINQTAGLKNKDASTPPTNGNFGLYRSSVFSGSYANWSGSVVLDTTYGNPNNLGAMQGCMSTLNASQQPGGGYTYFRVLLAR